MSRKSNDASRHGPGPSGAVPRHATSHSADATDELSRRPVEPEGSGDGARRPGAACREGMAASRRGMGGPRERGFCARGGLLLVPEGRWGVATGGASRRDAEPVDGTRACGFCPAGAEGSSPTRHGRTGADGAFLRPCRGGFDAHDAFHGLRSLEDSLTPPVATTLDPSGVERHGDDCRENGHARAIGARARAGGVHAFVVFVPEGRRGVATGGARASRAEPVDGTRACGFCPAGAEGYSPTRHGRTGADGAFLRPCRGGFDSHDAFHGLRIAQSGDAPPVATGRDPSGVERRGDVRAMGNAARAIGARARAGGVHAFAGEVPEGRPPHTPLWHQRTGGSEVRRGF